MKALPKAILGRLAVAAVCGLLSQQAQAAGPIIGRITFAGSVELDQPTVDTATMVTAWHGPGPADKPQVQSRDGDFATFVNVFDDTTFAPTWPFNSGAIPNFWSVDNFTFNLINSAILSQGGGFLAVAGTGSVSGNGFTATPATWTFTTQDPPAGSPREFSFSASTSAVPEGNTMALLAIGGFGIAGVHFLRKKGKTT
jgi:hypothetical protein